MRPIIRAAADYFRVTEADIMGRRRSRPIVKVRAAIALVMRYRDGLSYPQIGRRIGGRDHSTVINCVNQGWMWMVSDEDFGPFVDAQMCMPRFSPVAAHVPSPFPAPFIQPPLRERDRHLEPCPAHLVKLKPVPREPERFTECGYRFTLDEDGLSAGDRYELKQVAVGSQMLIQALRSAHPERFAHA